MVLRYLGFATMITDHVASQCRVESLNNWELSLCLQLTQF